MCVDVRVRVLCACAKQPPRSSGETSQPNPRSHIPRGSHRFDWERAPRKVSESGSRSRGSRGCPGQCDEVSISSVVAGGVGLIADGWLGRSLLTVVGMETAIRSPGDFSLFCVWRAGGRCRAVGSGWLQAWDTSSAWPAGPALAGSATDWEAVEGCGSRWSVTIWARRDAALFRLGLRARSARSARGKKRFSGVLATGPRPERIEPCCSLTTYLKCRCQGSGLRFPNACLQPSRQTACVPRALEGTK